MPYEYYQVLKLNKIYNVKKESKDSKVSLDSLESLVSFDTNIKPDFTNLNFDLSKIVMIDYVKEASKKYSYRLIITLIFTLFILILFSLNQFMLREIIFEDERYHNDLVYNYVKNETYQIGPFIGLKTSLTNLSKELRTNFYQYAYVGVIKRGSKLVIKIVYQDVLENNHLDNQDYGEYFASSDATISYIGLSSGVMLVKYHDTIKAGTKLATSNLLEAEKLFNKDQMVPLKGFIIGKVKEYYLVKIPKKTVVEIFTSRQIITYYLKTKSKDYFRKTSPYELSYEKEDRLLKIGNLAFVKRIIYEKIKQEISYTKEEALNYALIKLYQDYESKRINSLERINEIKLVLLKENDFEYLFNFLVDVDKNIAVFKPF